MGVFFKAYINAKGIDANIVEVDDIRDLVTGEPIPNSDFFCFLPDRQAQQRHFTHNAFVYNISFHTDTVPYNWYSVFFSHLKEVAGYKEGDSFSPLYLLATFSDCEGSLDNQACSIISSQLELVNSSLLGSHHQQFFSQLKYVFKLAADNNGIVSLH